MTPLHRHHCNHYRRRIGRRRVRDCRGGSNGGNGSGSVVMDTLFRWLDADRSNALSKSEVAALLPLLHQV